MLRLRKILLCDLVFYLILILNITYIIIYLNNYKLINKYSINDKSFVLKIKNYKINEDKVSIVFDNIIGNYYLNNITSDEFINNYSLNDKVLVNGTLIIPDNNTIPNTFNYKEYLYHKKIKYIIKIEDIKVINKNKSILYKIKDKIYKRVNSINNNEYIYAFILGDSSHINENVYNNYKTNSITHLFALSGLHVTLFSSIIMFFISKITKNELLSFLIVSILLIFFSFIASFTPSILRAVIFFILSNINNIYYFFIKPKNLLYITFSILTFINPNYIFNNGFILSFTISFFILLFNEYNNKSSLLKISVISFLSSLPIVINMNYEINIIGFINNIFFIPFVSTLVFPISLISIIIPRISFILKLLTNILEFISSISSNILNITLFFQKLNIIEIIIYYILLILIIKKKRVIKYFIVLILFLYFKPNLDNNSYVYFLDVKQGDCALIVSKHNKSIVIDTGGNLNYDLMNTSIIPFYKSIGLKKIDYLFISHGDADHCGFSSSLSNSFKVNNIYINNDNVNYCEKKLNYEYTSNYYKIDNIEIYSLNNTFYNNENDDSLFLLVIIDNYSFLFTGDVSKRVEEDIINKYNLNNIDVLKVAHHGSNTSTSNKFISTINPKYSVISVGKDNKFGHPSSETLDVLSKSKIYRTDIDGSISFKINDKLSVDLCKP